MKNLAGQTFGHLTVVRECGRNKYGNVLWHCRCRCGEETVIRSPNLSRGDTQSCGCLKHRGNASRHREACHGRRTAEYRTWINMRTRCGNPHAAQYPLYGGRGIKVYWARFEDFLAYLLSSIGRKPSSQYSIDRIDVNGDYCPGNIRWATAKEQTLNRRISK